MCLNFSSLSVQALKPRHFHAETPLIFAWNATSTNIYPTVLIVLLYPVPHSFQKININLCVIFSTHCFLPFVEETGIKNAIQKKPSSHKITEFKVTGLILNLRTVPSKETLFCSWKYLYHNFTDRGTCPSAISKPEHPQKKLLTLCPDFIDLNQNPFGFDHLITQFLFFLSLQTSFIQIPSIFSPSNSLQFEARSVPPSFCLGSAF